MPIFTPEILAMARAMKANTAEWGIDDDGDAYAEFEGERATVPIEDSHDWWPIPLNAACEQAHASLEKIVGRKIEYHFYGRSHPYGW